MEFGQLQRHVVNNDFEFFRNLMTNHSADITFVGVVLKARQQSSGDTLLHIACKHGSVDVLRYLVQDLGADTEVSNKDGKRPIHDAAQFSQTECLQFLLESKVQVDPIKRADWTPLMLACTKSCLESVTMLLKAGADPYLRNKDGWNSFHIASREGHLEILQCLQTSHPSVWDTRSNNLRSPLHTAAFHGHANIVSWMLQVCSYEPDVEDSCGVTPLMDALRGGHIETAGVLMEGCEVDPRKEDKTGRAAIHQVCQTGQDKSLDILVNVAKVCINTQSSVSGQTPLHICAQSGQLEVLHRLLCYGADINAQDFKGRTALHQACGGQHYDCVVTLLKHGAQIVTDNMGHPPHHYAKKSNVLEALEKAQGSLSRQDTREEVT